MRLSDRDIFEDNVVIKCLPEENFLLTVELRHQLDAAVRISLHFHDLPVNFQAFISSTYSKERLDNVNDLIMPASRES